MQPSAMNSAHRNKLYGYLSIERFLSTFLDAQALKLGLENGLIGYLAKNASAGPEDILRNASGDAQGLLLLLRLLRANHVVTETDGRFSLTPEFAFALSYRELIESKIDFANLVMEDLKDHFALYVERFDRFMQTSRIFDLFSYRRCYTMTEENYSITGTWMRFTTAVTKYEALVCMERHDFGGYRTILDIGGNSGEFVLQLCKNHPHLHATVFDLPVVCEVGIQHVRGNPESDRIHFIKGDALVDPVIGKYDAVSFKSFLHDWPDAEVELYLKKAYTSLNDGGVCIIFERGPLDLEKGTPSYAMIPVLLFYRNFRIPERYLTILKNAGFSQCSFETIELETPFFIISAKK